MQNLHSNILPWLAVDFGKFSHQNRYLCSISIVNLDILTSLKLKVNKNQLIPINYCMLFSQNLKFSKQNHKSYWKICNKECLNILKPDNSRIQTQYSLVSIFSYKHVSTRGISICLVLFCDNLSLVYVIFSYFHTWTNWYLFQS